MAAAGAPPSSMAQMAKSASAPSLEALSTKKNQFSLEGSMDFTKFNVRDREFLKSFAHRRSRKTLRELSYPNLPGSSSRRRRAQQTGDAVVSGKAKPDEQQMKAAVAITLSPLEFALGKGPEAEAAEKFIFEAKKATRAGRHHINL